MQSSIDDRSEQKRARLGFALLMALLILVAAGKAVLYDTLDPDCWWHIRVADQLLRDGIGPIVDHLSFASIKSPWTPYSWLGELAMRAIWNFGGIRAAVACQAILVGGFFAFVALTILELTQSPRAYVGIVVAMVFAEYLSLPYLSFRPATMSLLILAMIAWLIARDRRLQFESCTIWLVVPLTVLNINVHLFALFAPLLCGSMWLDDLLTRSPHRRSLVLTIATSLACLATPMLPGLITSVVHYSAADPMVSAGVIAELRPFWAGSVVSITSAALLGAAICIVMHQHEFRLRDWCAFALGAFAILRMGRLAPIFVIVAAPMLAIALPNLRGRILSKPAIVGLLAIVLIVGVSRIAQQFPRHETTVASWVNRLGPNLPGYPCDAAEFVERNVSPTTGRIINDFNWGGYLAWQLGPRFEVFMDPRTQLYTPDFWKQACLGDTRSTIQSLRAANADAAIVPLKSLQLKAAVEALGWKPVFRDNRAAVYVPMQSSLASISE